MNSDIGSTNSNTGSPPSATKIAGLTTLERWKRVVFCVLEEEPGERRALENLLDFALNTPANRLDVEATCTAYGMIRMAAAMREITDATWPLERGKARVLSWLMEQDGERRDVEWPIALVSQCLYVGPSEWAEAFARHVDGEPGEQALARLEDFLGVSVESEAA